MRGIASRLVILAIGITLTGSVPSVSGSWQKPVPANYLQEAKPTSPITIIIMKITGSDDTQARAAVIEGGSLKVEDVKSESTIAFVPTVDKDDNKNVLVKVCQVSKTDSDERFDEIETIEVSLGSYKTLQTLPQYKIEIEAIAKHIPGVGQPFKMPAGIGDAVKSSYK